MFYCKCVPCCPYGRCRVHMSEPDAVCYNCGYSPDSFTKLNTHFRKKNCVTPKQCKKCLTTYHNVKHFWHVGHHCYQYYDCKKCNNYNKNGRMIRTATFTYIQNYNMHRIHYHNDYYCDKCNSFDAVILPGSVYVSCVHCYKNATKILVIFLIFAKRSNVPRDIRSMMSNYIMKTLLDGRLKCI